ncbi:MAG: oligosaccharide flippase family protein [Thermodesulfobacteriota bacterium]|nr:oligosaccharide flippase family protein [Thermodesulfobacteriota bacterium]
MLKKILTNSLSNMALQFLNIIVVFVMTPVIVKSLGNYDYGIWEIVMSVIGYMGLLQFGIPPAIVRYVAKYDAVNEKNKLNEIYSSVFLIILLTGLLCGLVIALWALYFPEVLFEHKSPGRKYTLFLLILSIHVLIMFPSIFIESFHEGFQRYKLTRFITALKLIISNLVAYILFNKGYGLLVFALINSISLFLKFFILWILLMMPAFGGFRLKIKHFKKNTIKDLYAFGVKSFALGIAGRITFQTDSIVIGLFLNPAVVAFYIIPVNLLNKLKVIGMSMTLVLMPHFSAIYAKKEGMDTFTSEFFLYSRYIVGIILCIFLSVFFLGLPFLSLWIGPEYAQKGKYVLFMIGLAFLLPFLNPLQGRILTSMGMHGILAKIRILEALMNLSLSLSLVHFYGKEGVALGTLLPALMFEPFILWVVSNRLNISSWYYFKSVLVPPVLPVLTTSLLYYYLTKSIIPNSYGNILLAWILCSSAYVICFCCFVMSKDERNQIFQKFKYTALKI